MTPIDRFYAKAVSETTLCSIGKGDCNRHLTPVPCRYRGKRHPQPFILKMAHEYLAAAIGTDDLIRDAGTMEQTS